MPIITVIARAKARKGQEAALEAAIKKIVEPTKEEKGCLKYSIQRSLEDSGLFTTIEEWDSKESADKHMNTPHIQELLTQLPALLAAPPDIQAFQSIF